MAQLAWSSLLWFAGQDVIIGGSPPGAGGERGVEWAAW